LSQRTRAHTTGAANRNPPEADSQSSRVTSPARPGSRTRRASRTAHAEAGDTSPHPRHEAGADADQPLAADVIVRTLRAVANELERDPALASRVAAATGVAPVPPAVSVAHPPSLAATEPATEPTAGRRSPRPYRPKLVTGASPDLGPGIPDPFVLRARLGRAGLESALTELRLGSLRAIVREHKLDPGAQLLRQNDADRLRQLILRATDK
jgi:hypothetical protein